MSKKGKFPVDEDAYNLLKFMFVSIESKYRNKKAGASSSVHGHGLRPTKSLTDYNLLVRDHGPQRTKSL
jgi:hypothetical protein